MEHGLFTIFLHLSGPCCQEGRESLIQPGNKNMGHLQGRVHCREVGTGEFPAVVTHMDWIQVMGFQFRGFMCLLLFLTSACPRIFELNLFLLFLTLYCQVTSSLLLHHTQGLRCEYLNSLNSTPPTTHTHVYSCTRVCTCAYTYVEEDLISVILPCTLMLTKGLPESLSWHQVPGSGGQKVITGILRATTWDISALRNRLPFGSPLPHSALPGPPSWGD